MSNEFPRSRASIAGHPIHPMLVPVPIVCFIGTFLCDLSYVYSPEPQWVNFSSWLLTIGLIVSIFVAITGITDFLGDRRIRGLYQSWVHGIGNAVALLLSIWNAFVHTRDGYTAVVPTGITLSTIVVAILAITAWHGGSMVFRHGVGVRPEQNR